MTATDPELRASVAHVLRRTSFGPFPGQVDEAIAEHGSLPGVIEAIIAAPPPRFAPSIGDPTSPDGGAIDPDHLPVDEDLRHYLGFRKWWPERMRSDDAGLHDKMAWFWHTHFTSAFTKVDSTEMCWEQIARLHRHATGNFGELAREIVTDRAMLRYLDGDGSSPSAPNENFAREMMELFTLGIGHYEQSDVVVASRAFAGWYIDQDRTLRRMPGVEATTSGTFLGEPGPHDAGSIVDVILAQPACAPFVVDRIWRFLGGGDPDRDRLGEWADLFRSSDYEIAPVVAAILRSPEFLAARHRRARTPVEWHSAVMRAAGVEQPSSDELASLGQTPYGPPNPSGWPGDDAWLSATHAHAKALLLRDLPMPAAAELASQPDLVGAVLERSSLYDLPDGQRAVLDALAADLASRSVPPPVAAASVMAAAFLTPTFALA